MDIKRNGLQPYSKGSADYFTREVRIDPLLEAQSLHLLAGEAELVSPKLFDRDRAAWHCLP
jgi:hypothetical protein